MRTLLIRFKRTILAGILGAVMGYTYFHIVGCSAGSCVLSSHPLISISYGAVMAVLVVGWPEKKQTSNSIIHE